MNLTKDAYNIFNLEQDTCGSRNVIYRIPIEGKALQGHVIARKAVDTKEQCEVECYLNPDCVSLNFKTAMAGDRPLNCELSSSDEINHPKNLTSDHDSIYEAMKVWLSKFYINSITVIVCFGQSHCVQRFMFVYFVAIMYH